jgi:hypothetical protein
LDIAAHLQLRSLLAQTDQVFVKGKHRYSLILLSQVSVAIHLPEICAGLFAFIPLMDVTLVMSDLHDHASKNWNSSQSPGSERTEIKTAFL